MNKLSGLLCIALLTLLVTACAAMAPVATPTPQPSATFVKATVAPVDAERTLAVGDLQRSYLLHVPAGLDSHTPAPLVFAFHGFQESPEAIRQYTGMNAIADLSGFVVAYPAGVGGGWNAAICCGDAVTDNVDDGAFVRQVIADVGTLIPVDPKRIYATGFSNGALLSYRLACEMPDVLAAVAPVAGVLVTDPCEPKGPISLLHMHGLLDTNVPFEGGPNSALASLVFPPVSDGLAKFAALDGCGAAPQVSKDGVVTHSVYAGCKPGLAVELITNDVSTHVWPSRYVMTPPLSQTIWAFFEAHPKP